MAFRAYLDANILILIFESIDDRTPVLLDLMNRGSGRTPIPLVTSELTIAEMLVLPYRNQNLRLAQLYQTMSIANPTIEIVPVGRECLWQAPVLRAKHRSLKLPDAIHLSTALLLGCSHMLTADAKLAGFGPLTSDDRTDPDQTKLSLQIAKPDIDTLRALIAGLEA